LNKFCPREKWCPHLHKWNGYFNLVHVLPWIHIDDTVGIMEHAIQSDITQGILNAVSPGTVTNYEFTEVLGEALKRPTI
jgi:NAD dependent epimerase/dehydratase family enzyme